MAGGRCVGSVSGRRDRQLPGARHCGHQRRRLPAHLPFPETDCAAPAPNEPAADDTAPPDHFAPHPAARSHFAPHPAGPVPPRTPPSRPGGTSHPTQLPGTTSHPTQPARSHLAPHPAGPVPPRTPPSRPGGTSHPTGVLRTVRAGCEVHRSGARKWDGVRVVDARDAVRFGPKPGSSAPYLRAAGTWTHRHLDSPAPGLTGTRTHRHLDSPTAGLTGTWTHRHLYSPAPGLTGTWDAAGPASRPTTASSSSRGPTKGKGGSAGRVGVAENSGARVAGQT